MTVNCFRVTFECIVYCLLDGRFVQSINQCIPSHRIINDLHANGTILTYAEHENVAFCIRFDVLVLCLCVRRWIMSFDKFQGVSLELDARMHSIGWQK